MMDINISLKENTINVSGTDIHYLSGGVFKKSRTPLLFLHGWALSVVAFKKSLELLAQDYYIIAPDLPGFGKSSSLNSSWSYEDHAQALIRFVECLEVEAVHLIGHSTGGGIAITIAATHPLLVQSLALIDSSGIPIGSLRKVLLKRLVELPIQALFTLDSTQHLALIASTLYNVIFKTIGTIDSVYLPLKIDLREYMLQIKAPSIVVWGERDWTMPLEFGMEISSILGSKLVIVDNGFHEWSILLPEKFVSIVSNFVEKID